MWFLPLNEAIASKGLGRGRKTEEGAACKVRTQSAGQTEAEEWGTKKKKTRNKKTNAIKMGPNRRSKKEEFGGEVFFGGCEEGNDLLDPELRRGTPRRRDPNRRRPGGGSRRIAAFLDRRGA